MRFLLRHLTFANVMSTVAVFIALGGSAVALKSNSVNSREIKNGTIKSRDVSNGNLKGKDLKDETITSAQVDEGRFSLERFVEGKAGGGTCDPTSTSPYTACGATTITLQERSDALIVASGGGKSQSTTVAAGVCRLTVDGVESNLQTVGQLGDASRRTTNGFALTDVAEDLAPGRHLVGLECNETSPDFRVSFSNISVLAIGGTGVNGE